MSVKKKAKIISELLPIIFKDEPVIYSHYKVILSGRFAEVYNYTLPVVLNRKPVNNRRVWSGNADMIFDKDFQNQSFRADEYKKRRYSRAFQQMSRFIECNMAFNRSAFITLTFDYNMMSMRVAKDIFFKPFIVRFKKFYPDLIYIGVTEFQKRGAVHFHLLVNQFIDIPVLDYCWPWGACHTKKPYSPHALGVYFAKYLTKNHKNPKFRESKYFFTSHKSKYNKIIKPKIIYHHNAKIYADYLFNSLVPVYSRVYTIPDFTKSYFGDNPIVNYVRAEKYNIGKLLPLDLRFKKV